MRRRSSVDLSDDLQQAVHAEALKRGCSDNEVIRDALRACTCCPPPGLGPIDGDPLAEGVDHRLGGFGAR